MQRALNTETVEEEERGWTDIIETYGPLESPWRDDLIGRAYGNR